jgi:hypothetical protein
MIPAGTGGLDERAKRLLALALMGGNAAPAFVRYDRPVEPMPRLPRSALDEAANALRPEEEAPSFDYDPDTDHDAAGSASGADAAIPGGHANRISVEQARKIAVREARAYIAQADIRRHADEDGFYAVYNPQAGNIRYYRGPEAGRPVGDDFEFSIKADIGNDVLLVTAHSHPKGYCNRANEIRRPRDLNRCDQRLWQVAPFVVRNPSGRVVVLEPPEKFESLSWLNQFHEVNCEPDHRKCR